MKFKHNLICIAFFSFFSLNSNNFIEKDLVIEKKLKESESLIEKKNNEKIIVKDTMVDKKKINITHKIVKGDTLWDLAGKYLGDNVEWKYIQNQNFEVANDPYNLKIGDIIHIDPVNKTISIEKLEFDNININPFLLNQVLYDVVLLPKEKISDFPSVVLSEKRQNKITLLDKFYATKDNIELNKKYTVYRKNKNINEKIEYYEIGKAFSESYLDNLAILKAIEVRGHIQKGDILIPENINLHDFLYTMSYKKLDNFHNIISIVNNKSKATLFDLLILDINNEKVSSGDIINLYRKSESVINPKTNLKNVIPPSLIGKAAIIKTNEEFSLAIIIKSNFGAEIKDKVH